MSYTIKVRCPKCNVEFLQKRHWQIYCTNKCRQGPANFAMLRAESQVFAEKYKAQAVKLDDSFFKLHKNVACVYGWYRFGSYIYIGDTNDLGGRLRIHRVIGHLSNVYDCDQLHLWKTERIDMGLEAFLIHQFKPYFNFGHNVYHDRADVKYHTEPCEIIRFSEFGHSNIWDNFLTD